MVALINKKCRVCYSEQDITVKIADYIDTINEYLPITIEKNDGHGDKICHKCLFDITLCGELISKYKEFRSLPEGNKCYLCLKENVNLPIHGGLFRIIRKIESSLTIKNILRSTGVIGHASWQTIKKQLRDRKICSECFFLVESVADLYDRIKKTDAAIKKIVDETEKWLFGEDPFEAEQNRRHRKDYCEASSSSKDSERNGANGVDIKQETNVEEEDSDVSDELSAFSENGEGSDVENEINNHSLIKCIKEEVDNDDLPSAPEGSQELNIRKVKKEPEDIKQEPVSSEDEGGTSSGSDDDENLINFSNKKTRGTKKNPPRLPVKKNKAVQRVNRKIKQEINSDVDGESDIGASVNGFDSDDDDEDEEEQPLNKKMARGKGKQTKKSVDISDVASQSSAKTGVSPCCYLCKVPLRGKIPNNHLCLSCVEKYRQAMAGIHAGRICRVFVTDLKYDNPDMLYRNGRKVSKVNSGSKYTYSDDTHSNKKRKRNDSLSSENDFDPPVKSKKQSKIAKQSLSKRRDSNASSVSIQSSASESLVSRSKYEEKKVLKTPVPKSVVSTSTHNEVNTCTENVSESKKRKRTASVASSTSSEKDYFNSGRNIKVHHEKNTYEDSDALLYPSKKKKEFGHYSDDKLKFIERWHIKLEKIPLLPKLNSLEKTNANESLKEDTVEKSDVKDKLYKKPGPKSKTHLTSAFQESEVKNAAIATSENRNSFLDDEDDGDNKTNMKENGKRMSKKVRKSGPKSRTQNVSDTIEDDSFVFSKLDLKSKPLSKNDPNVENISDKLTEPTKVRKSGPKSKICRGERVSSSNGEQEECDVVCDKEFSSDLTDLSEKDKSKASDEGNVSDYEQELLLENSSEGNVDTNNGDELLTKEEEDALLDEKDNAITKDSVDSGETVKKVNGFDKAEETSKDILNSNDKHDIQNDCEKISAHKITENNSKQEVQPKSCENTGDLLENQDTVMSAEDIDDIKQAEKDSFQDDHSKDLEEENEDCVAESVDTNGLNDSNDGNLDQEVEGDAVVEGNKESTMNQEAAAVQEEEEEEEEEEENHDTSSESLNLHLKENKEDENEEQGEENMKQEEIKGNDEVEKNKTDDRKAAEDMDQDVSNEYLELDAGNISEELICNGVNDEDVDGEKQADDG